MTRFILLAISLFFNFQFLYSYYEGSSVFENIEDSHLEIIAKFIPKDPVIFEAGGHDGFDAIRFSKRWPLATIITFEPNPYSYEQFKKATRGIPNILGYQLALFDYNGTTVFNVCGIPGQDPMGYLGSSSILESSDWNPYPEGSTINVPCVTLDDWSNDNLVKTIDFLWLDLEGVELQVLQAAPKTLKNVKVIYIETNFKEFRKQMTQYANLKPFLEESGFKVLAHWYDDNQGNAIFVKEELLSCVKKSDFLTKDRFLKNDYTDHVAFFDLLFSHTSINTFLEFGLGEGTKYFLDNCRQVTSFDMLARNRWDVHFSWHEKCLDLYSDYENWNPISYICSEQINWAHEFASQYGANPSLMNGAYLKEINSICNQLTQDTNYDLAFVDPGVVIRCDIVNALFEKVDIIVTHDTNHSTDVYGWNRITPPDTYTKLHYNTFAGVTAWIKNDKKELIEYLQRSGAY